MLILDQSTINKMNIDMKKGIKYKFGEDDKNRFQAFFIGFIIGVLVNLAVQYYRQRQEKEEKEKRYNWTQLAISGLIAGIVCWIYTSF